MILGMTWSERIWKHVTDVYTEIVIENKAVEMWIPCGLLTGV